MRFDEWWDWDQEPTAVDHGHTQKVPDGRHTGDIIKAEVKDLKFKVTDANPSGTCLVVQWSKSATYYPVESVIPINWRGLIEAVCRAAGVATPQRGQDWEPQSLVGRVATVDVENVVASSGKEYQRIGRWHTSPQQPLPPAEKAPPRAKRAAARTPAAKAHAEFQEHADADDIPF